MNLDLTQIICSAITAVSAIVVARLTFSVKKEGAENREASKAENKAILRRLDENDLRTSRIDLRTALEHSRDDIPAMLELALDYFVVQGGDADLGPKFLYWVKEYKVEEWATAHHKDISQIIKCATHRTEV